MAESKTVKVRIAVAVDHTGAWSSRGWSHHTDPEKLKRYAADDLKLNPAFYFVTAELPIPEVQPIPEFPAEVKREGE